VLAPVEQHDGQPVTVFDPQLRGPGVGRGVHVGRREAEPELVRQYGKAVLRPVAQPTPCTRQQDYLMLHDRNYPVP
jgi:hypothetical protein